MSNNAPQSPSRLTKLLALANVAALLCLAYLARRDANSEVAWNARQSRAASLASSAAILGTGRLEAANATNGELINDAGVTGTASALPEILRRAGIDAEHLVSVVPDAPRPIPNTPLIRTSERIAIEDLSLEQIVRVAGDLAGLGSGRELDSLWLRATRTPHSERWDAELTLSSIKRDESAGPLAE